MKNLIGALLSLGLEGWFLYEALLVLQRAPNARFEAGELFWLYVVNMAATVLAIFFFYVRPTPARVTTFSKRVVREVLLENVESFIGLIIGSLVLILIIYFVSTDGSYKILIPPLSLVTVSLIFAYSFSAHLLQSTSVDRRSMTVRQQNRIALPAMVRLAAFFFGVYLMGYVTHEVLGIETFDKDLAVSITAGLVLMFELGTLVHTYMRRRRSFR